VSVVIVRANALCDTCISMGLPAEEAEGGGGLRLVVECNDLCSACIQDDAVFVRFPEDSEQELVKAVIKRSEWCRRERWRSRWRHVKAWFLHQQERFQRWNNYGYKAFEAKPGYTRCSSCGYNYLPEDLDPSSGDTDICMSCDDHHRKVHNGEKA
jgi:hypothetical protein